MAVLHVSAIMAVLVACRVLWRQHVHHDQTTIFFLESLLIWYARLVHPFRSHRVLPVYLQR